ncbi:helix-turn-helix domain-containing protein [Paenarthrobacter nicotinovorans]|uniref:helix-turn-helix domain-containing protein n=1 Tax=Paenarthrobacter nicotinovorans TaxID=29320 RepID=UPI0038254734
MTDGPESIQRDPDKPDIYDPLKLWEDFTADEASREVSALEALRVNARAVDRLTARRWYVMKAAREAGATWSQIGQALGVTRQAAYDFYRRKTEEQEKYAHDPKDPAAARAVLESDP